MLIHLVGGRDDGETIDTDDPGGWWPTEGEFTLPLPDVLHVHCARANRAAYRLAAASPDDCTYRLDAALTAAYRAAP